MPEVRIMIDYDPQGFAYLQKKMAGVLDAIERPGFLEGKGIGNNYPSFVFEYDPVFEPFMEKSVGELKQFLAQKLPEVQVTLINLFDFGREFLQSSNKWSKSLELEIAKGEGFLFDNLPRTLNGSAIADHFLQTVLLTSPGLILIYGVGLAYPMLRGHEVLKNLPQRIGKTIPIILFYPGEYDGKYLRPFGRITEQNEYQAIRWQFS
jgi:hypothetical protein